MTQSAKVHRNPNFLIALIVLVLVVAIALFTSPQKTSTPKPQDDTKVVKQLPIKELGVQLGLTGSLKNLEYKYQNTPLGPGAPQRPLVLLSDKTYTDLANRCTGLKDNTVILKTIVKVDGQAGKQTGSAALRQLKDYYVVALDSGTPSSDSCKKSKIRPQLEALYKKLNSQLDSSIKSAQAI